MTIDEAIKAMQNIDLVLSVTDSEHEAARMAISALRAQQERENPQPLTLEDLRGMDGEWVWAISSDPDLTVSAWAYIVASQAHTLCEYKPDRLLGNVQLDFENYGKTWLAYRSKPKEENT